MLVLLTLYLSSAYVKTSPKLIHSKHHLNLEVISMQLFIFDNIIYLNKGYDVSPERDPQIYKVKTNNKKGDGELVN